MSPLAVLCLGCGDMVDGDKVRNGRCIARCAQPHEQALNRAKNAHPRRQVYDHPLWQSTRQSVFYRDAYTCVDCDRHRDELNENETLVCDHVDGIDAILARGGDPFALDECQTRCSTCSGRKDGARGSR